uniref:Small ribosomal subunit protein uS3c n=1 Tax=Cyanoptyche gloeocystis TaxID=77922 RepID=A0A3G1IWH2_9EUKA|nr:ribosomal protein S3 [Cyanoptyche gloeocystis]
MFLQEDYKIRQFLKNHLKKARIADVYIHRKTNQIELDIRTARPGLIIGRAGAQIKQLKENIASLLDREQQIRINVIEIKQVETEAALIANYIVEKLESRKSFRLVVRKAISRVQKAGIKGIKIQVSGRLNGAEIARSEWSREGRVPLQTLRANIDYSYQIAQTIYGVLGIKVWLFKGEISPINKSH